jgi:hypothetical protein
MIRQAVEPAAHNELGRVAEPRPAYQVLRASGGSALLFLVLNGLNLLLLLYDRLRCFNRTGRLFFLGQAQPSLRHVGQNGPLLTRR